MDEFVHRIVEGRGGSTDADYWQGADKPQNGQTDTVCDFIHDLNHKTIIIE